MKPARPVRFSDQKDGFAQILADPFWPAKILLAGFLLINPFLVALAPAYFSGTAPVWVARALPWILGFNVLSFWFPLGFTYEVLRRARTGRDRQLPDWRIDRLAVFAREGAVKLVLAIFTLLLPAALGLAAGYGLFVHFLGLPVTILSLLAPPLLLFLIPFCAVACCRWLDGHSVLDCALNYPENIRLFRRAPADYLLASAFIVGVNAITTSFFYTIPFGAIFGLCLVDTWFGPIYAESVARFENKSLTPREAEETVLASR